MNNSRITVLDPLRGIAALMVVLCHYSGFTLPTLRPNAISEILYFGRYGVDVFFVISGLIIPYSMYVKGYTIKSFGNYLLKRIIRVNPPYYLAFLLSVILFYSAILIKGAPIEGMLDGQMSWSLIIGHLTYLAPYMNEPWLTPVFWTLAIEFQFYILIGLLLPSLTHSKTAKIFICCSLLLLGFLPYFSFFKYASIFVLGLLIFLNLKKLISPREFYIMGILTCGFIWVHNGGWALTFSMATAVIIYFDLNPNNTYLNFLGKISYSLYLSHWIFGNVSEAIIKRIIVPPYSSVTLYALLILYIALSILFATFFYTLVEKRFLFLSKKLD